MKKLLLLTYCLWVASILNAQKIITKAFSFANKESLSLNLNIADSIQIVTWNKNEVSVKCSININDNKYNDDYKVSFDESGKSIEVRAKFETDRKTSYNDPNCCNYRSAIIWEVMIPENAPFEVETINGDIIIVGKTDEIKAHTISGFIDLSVPIDRKADFKLSTITGTVYSDILNQSNSKKHSNYSDICDSYNGGGKQVNLKTISGNIYLRKAGSQ
ncbi:MAG: DUF4097 family beta strand repeat-containing protein [Chitinophagaceae bacterium]